LKIDVGGIRQEQSDSENEATEISDDILIEGKFSEDTPEVFEGSSDKIEKTPGEFQEFIKAITGDVKEKIRWKLKKKDKR
jgi:hypothetical protein